MHDYVHVINFCIIILLLVIQPGALLSQAVYIMSLLALTAAASKPIEQHSGSDQITGITVRTISAQSSMLGM